jgi:hypothetical protein
MYNLSLLSTHEAGAGCVPLSQLKELRQRKFEQLVTGSTSGKSRARIQTQAKE